MVEHIKGSEKKKFTREYLQNIEIHAEAIRRKAGVNGDERFDPWERSAQLGLKIIHADDIAGLPEKHKAHIRSMSPREWSGGGEPRKLHDGRMLIILHPKQTIERKNVTILEEVAHDHYGHKPSVLNGSGRQGFNEALEQEAYQTAAAALLPMKVVAKAVWRGLSAKELGQLYGASEELAEMRIKTLKLWSLYKEKQV